MIDGSIKALQAFHDGGFRYMTLTGKSHTDWADCAMESPRCGGLSWFGEGIVDAMNRFGLLIDLANGAVGTIKDVLMFSRAPVIFSRAGVRALCQHPCNLSDDLLRRIKQRAGLVMVPFAAELIDPSGATVSKVADHLAYIRTRIGVESVGIGRADDAQWLGSASNLMVYPQLFAELTRRGWTNQELDLLIRGNLLRVLQRVEDTAAFCRSLAPPAKTPELP